MQNPFFWAFLDSFPTPWEDRLVTTLGQWIIGVQDVVAGIMHTSLDHPTDHWLTIDWLVGVDNAIYPTYHVVLAV